MMSVILISIIFVVLAFVAVVMGAKEDESRERSKKVK